MQMQAGPGFLPCSPSWALGRAPPSAARGALLGEAEPQPPCVCGGDPIEDPSQLKQFVFTD